MGAILDLIGSYVFKAAMIGIILATSVSLNEVMTKKAQLTNLEKTMNVSLSVIDWDLRNIGYNYSGSPKIAYFTTSTFKYYGDIDNNGALDSVQWTVSAPFVTVGDSLVKRYTVSRRLNNGSYYTVLKGLRHLDVIFLDASGNVVPTSLPGNVRAIRVKVTAESPFIINGEILTATRQITVFPPNLSL